MDEESKDTLNKLAMDINRFGCVHVDVLHSLNVIRVYYPLRDKAFVYSPEEARDGCDAAAVHVDNFDADIALYSLTRQKCPLVALCEAVNAGVKIEKHDLDSLAHVSGVGGDPHCELYEWLWERLYDEQRLTNLLLEIFES